MSAVLHAIGQPIPCLMRPKRPKKPPPPYKPVADKDLTRARPVARSLEPLIRQHMAADAWFTYHELAKAIQAPVQGVRRALERMVAAGSVERVIRGRYEYGAGQKATLFKLIKTGAE
jgi:hypothetical protein